MRKSYEKFAAEQIRLLRDGSMPFQGKSNVLVQVPDSGIKVKILGGRAVSDFAYAYGEYQLKMPDGKTEKGFYARVWKHEPKG